VKILVIFGLFALWQALRSLRTGTYNTVFFGRFTRAEKPVDFWFFVGGLLILSTIWLIIGIRDFVT